MSTRAVLIPITICSAVTALTVAAGCSSTPRYSAPQSFTVSNDAVAKVVHDAVAGDSDATPMNGSPVPTALERRPAPLTTRSRSQPGGFLITAVRWICN
jgi:hypothetical protein